MLYRKYLKLYLKVFVILFTVGVILPYLIDLFFGNILLIEDRVPFGNSLFVMYNNDCQDTFFKMFFKLLAKFIEF